MENSSKALIMAASILVSVMVIALATFLFITMGKFTKDKEEERYGKQLSEFNGQFLKYEGSKDITAQDVVSLANLAKNNNAYYGVPEGETSYICILFKGKHMEKEENLTKFIKENAYNANGEVIYYKCTKVEIDTRTGKVNRVILQNN